MDRWQRLAALALVATLGACSSQPSLPVSERYERQSWAKVGADQAQAECQAFINTAAGAGQNMYLCMKGKGYNER